MGKALTISSKGQITIPVAIRHRLGVDGGDKVEFVVEEGKTVLKPVRDGENPFTKWIGAFPAFRDQKEHDQWFREMRYGDEEPE